MLRYDVNGYISAQILTYMMNWGYNAKTSFSHLFEQFRDVIHVRSALILRSESFKLLNERGYQLRACVYDPAYPGFNEALNDFEV
jgi:hypothetical protein